MRQDYNDLNVNGQLSGNKLRELEEIDNLLQQHSGNQRQTQCDAVSCSNVWSENGGLLYKWVR